jgi:hypothetical protein
MSTRSNIGIEEADGSITAIYCHWDGYPSHNGKILLEHYKEASKVRSLIALGDLSSLGPEIGEKHSFDSDGEMARANGWSTAYHRDRGEELGPNCRWVNRNASLIGCEEWIYIFTSKGWVFAREGGRFYPLTFFACAG